MTASKPHKTNKNVGQSCRTIALRYLKICHCKKTRQGGQGAPLCEVICKNICVCVCVSHAPAKLASASAQLFACRKTLAAATCQNPKDWVLWIQKIVESLTPWRLGEFTKCGHVTTSSKFAIEAFEAPWESSSRPVHKAIVHTGNVQRHPRSQHDQALSLQGDHGDCIAGCLCMIKSPAKNCQRLARAWRCSHWPCPRWKWQSKSWAYEDIMFMFVYLCIYKYLNPLHMVKVSRRHLQKKNDYGSICVFTFTWTSPQVLNLYMELWKCSMQRDSTHGLFVFLLGVDIICFQGKLQQQASFIFCVRLASRMEKCEPREQNEQNLDHIKSRANASFDSETC